MNSGVHGSAVLKSILSDGEAFPARPGPDQLCLNLMEVLHAVAQPLTILQSRLDPSFVEQMGMEELQGALRASAKDTERLCKLFSYLQELVGTECVPPNLWAQPLAPVMERAAEGLQVFLNEGGVRLQVAVARDLMAFVDRMRLEQALSRVVLVFYGLSAANETVEMTAMTGPAGPRIVIENVTARGTLDKEAKMRLALAEASVRSQRGEMVWSADPLSVEIRLQQAPAANAGTDS